MTKSGDAVRSRAEVALDTEEEINMPKGTRPDPKKKILNYFERRLLQHGNSAASLGWLDKKSQEIRFQIICDVGNMEDASILDVGCGIGDLYLFLKRHLRRFEYLGVDISKSMVLAAGQRCVNAKFEQGDILDFDHPSLFDYVLGSGIYNLEVRDNEVAMPKIIDKMFRLCKKGIAVSMTCQQGGGTGQEHGYEPTKMLAFAFTLTPWVVLRRDYRLNDFTLYLYRNKTLLRLGI